MNVCEWCLVGSVPVSRQRFDNMAQLSSVTLCEGYSGGMRVMQATVHRFYQHLKSVGVAVPQRNFSLTYHTNVRGQGGAVACTPTPFGALAFFVHTCVQ